MFSSDGGADNNGAYLPDTNGKLQSTCNLNCPSWKIQIKAVVGYFSMVQAVLGGWHHHTVLFWHIIHNCITGNGNGRQKPVVDIQKGMLKCL